MVTNSFKAVFSKLEKSIKTSTNQALNKAATSTKALYAKEISAQTGLTSAKAKARAKVFKPTQTRPQFALSIGVRMPLPAHDFKPKSIKVPTSKGMRYGATIAIKGQGRQVVPGGFIAYGKGSAKALVLARTGSSRYPIKTVTVDIFRPLVERLVPTLQKHMVETFNKNFSSKLNYNLSK